MRGGERKRLKDLVALLTMLLKLGPSLSFGTAGKF